ncbi:hypothetical protein ABTM26_19340, partial [Acinetobacter baumannii]
MRSANADLVASRANQANAKAKYDRQEALLSEGAVSTSSRDDARTAYEVAVAAVTSSQSKVNAAKESV